MKKIFGILLVLAMAQVQSWAVKASVTYSTFKGETENFVEIQLHVVGSTVTFLSIDSLTSQAAVDVTLIFSKDEEVVKYDKFRLNSPVTDIPMDFIDLKRYALKNGTYQLEAIFEDANLEGNEISYEADLELFFSHERVQQSSIQLLSSYRQAKEGEESPFIKSGVYLEGAAFNFYGKYAENLSFYNEIYHTDKKIGEDFMVSYKIIHHQGNDKKETVVIGHKRKSPAPVVVLLQNIDIKTLPSGNYSLWVEVRNREKALLSKNSVFFQRSNPLLNAEQKEIADGAQVEEEFVANMTEDELRYALKALAPILSESDGDYINTLIKDNNPKAMKLYLFSYWALYNPNNAKAAFDEYMNVARAVDRTYASGFGYGFESDRGYIFMKYGKPSDVITIENDPNAPPYEIWSYNDFPRTNQNNVKFIFYNPSLATGQFLLLHSNARTEINNPQWEQVLYNEAVHQQLDGDYFSDTRRDVSIGSRARELFEDY